MLSNSKSHIMYEEGVEIQHYGTLRHSGRYPWGSGNNAYQHGSTFIGEVNKLSKDGLSDAEIAKGFGMSVGELKGKIGASFNEEIDKLRSQGMSDSDIAKEWGMSSNELKTRARLSNEVLRAEKVHQALSYKDHGYGNSEIGRLMGINESSVRSLLDASVNEKKSITTNIANELEKLVDKKGPIDVGKGTEIGFDIAPTTLKSALYQAADDGYELMNLKVAQLGTGKYTTTQVLVPPGMDYKTVGEMVRKGEVQPASDLITVKDYGRSVFGLRPIESIDQSRLQIRYADEGGIDFDGAIELRRGVSDLDLGESRYAQVRIAVDGTHYIKGMAYYSDNLPDGVDIRFNTNKKDTGSKLDALKPLKTNADGSIDQDNPFGAEIKRLGPGGVEVRDDEGMIKPGGQRGVLNIVNEEGDWSTWSNNLPSQFLSKQPTTLAKRQLDLAYDMRKQEYDDIMSLTNSTVKKKLLEDFGDSCDSAAVHMRGAALPRQGTYVILPFDIPDNQIYAPNYRDGERVSLVRYPHGGRFEIPELTVNNKLKGPKAILSDATDAVGISATVAERLSGADFDGDTVRVIPNNTGDVKSENALKGLKGFDPKREYAGYEGMRVMGSGIIERTPDGRLVPVRKDKNGKTIKGDGATNSEMGKISNLINDMSIKLAPPDEIVKAVRHSMVVIDAEKHGLNYRQSYQDNDIAKLKERYQGSARSGASTLISRATSEYRIPVVRTTSRIDPDTGKRVYKVREEEYVNKKGQTLKRQTTVKRMETTDDAYTLSSGTPMESIYADYANKLKSLGNTARKASVAEKGIEYSPSANKTYAKEVESLESKLKVSKANAPIERYAQRIAGSVVRSKVSSNPDLKEDKDAMKKVKNQALRTARERVGAKSSVIDITDSEWDAIQAGAISKTKLSEILGHADTDRVRQLATPRTKQGVPPAIEAQIRTRISQGYTQAEIADALGISVSTVNSIK